MSGLYYLRPGRPGYFEEKGVESRSTHGYPEGGLARPPRGRARTHVAVADLDGGDVSFDDIIGNSQADSRERLGRDESAAELLAGEGGALENCDAEAAFGGYAGSRGAGGAGADDDEVVVSHGGKILIGGRGGKGKEENGGRKGMRRENPFANHTGVVYTFYE